MKKSLYATISVAKNDENKELKIYKLQDEKYGVEVNTEENGKILDTKRAENVTIYEENINQLLDNIVRSIQDFEFLEYVADDYKDVKQSIV